VDEARLIELLVELHEGLERLGPGDDESTLRALRLCADLPPQPQVLDVGCGTGAQTLALAQHTAGQVTATDLMPTFLNTLEARLADRGLQDRVTTQVADMSALPFADGTFDVIWKRITCGICAGSSVRNSPVPDQPACSVPPVAALA